MNIPQYKHNPKKSSGFFQPVEMKTQDSPQPFPQWNQPQQSSFPQWNQPQWNQQFPQQNFVISATELIDTINKQEYDLKLLRDHIAALSLLSELEKKVTLLIDRLQNIESSSRQSSKFRRKVIGVNSTTRSLTMPDYVVKGEARCDKCGITELIHGFNFDGIHDLCSECFQSADLGEQAKEWLEFYI
jgi:hypothetical protein